MSDTDRGLIELRGEDSLKFLQGQVSCDLNQLRGDKIIHGCHCTPKGRVIFLFAAQLNGDSGILLETHPSIVELAIASLKKYAVFFNIQINDVSNQNLFVEPTLDALQRLRAGIADITSDTTNLFIPQMLNLDALDFISFKKGCYTGQEVVARAHYLGAVKRRMHYLTLACESVPISGQTLFDANNKPLGTIVNAQPNENGKIEALAVLSGQTMDCDSVYIDGQKTTVERLNLPYELS